MRADTAGDGGEHSYLMLGLFRHFSVLCLTKAYFLFPILSVTRDGQTALPLASVFFFGGDVVTGDYLIKILDLSPYMNLHFKYFTIDF